MAITRIQGNSVNSAGSVVSQVVTLPVGIANGNLIVVAVGVGINATTITPPDAAWKQATINLPAGASATIETALFYLVVNSAHTGQTTWTWNFSASHTVYICIEEWNTPYGWYDTPVDQIASGDIATVPVAATIIDSGTTLITTQPEELWVAALAYKGSAQTETNITAGWTRDLEATLAGSNTLTMLYRVVSATGTANCNYTIGTAAFFAGSVATFRTKSQADRPPGWVMRPRYVMRALTGSIFTPFQAIPAWVDRALGSNFVRQTQPVNIPRYVRRGLSSLLLNYALNISTRFRLRSADQFKDVSARLRLMSANQLRDIAVRLRLRSADQQKDVSSRFKLSLFKDIVVRLRLMSASQLKDIASRLRLMSAAQLRDIATRFRLRSANQNKDIATRFQLALFKNIAVRFRLMSASQFKDITTRFILVLAGQQIKDITARFRLQSASRLKDVVSRFRLKSASQLKDMNSRVRLMSANQLKNISLRFCLMSALQLRNIATRLVLVGVGIAQTRNISCRFVLTTPFIVAYGRSGNATGYSQDGSATGYGQNENAIGYSRSGSGIGKGNA
jgi:hypothetical protein